MGRNARIGLFLLMGLVVALARLIEVEVGKAKPSEEAQATPALIVPKPPRAVTPHAKKTHRSHGTPSAAPAPQPVVALDVAGGPPAGSPASGAAKDEPEGLEWPKGPVYTVKKGETLGVIAQKVLGTSKLAARLYEANAARITNPNFVKPGTRLLVPSRVAARHD